VWHVIRLPVLMLLVILEPIAAFILGGLARLGVLATIFFTLIEASHFPAWTVLLLSLGFAFVLIAYESLLRVLSR
jgi:hypothetical protein